MNEQFNKAYKPMSSRLNLLTKLPQNLTFEAAMSVYQSMMVPIFSFDFTVKIFKITLNLILTILEIITNEAVTSSFLFFFKEPRFFKSMPLEIRMLTTSME